MVSDRDKGRRKGSMEDEKEMGKAREGGRKRWRDGGCASSTGMSVPSGCCGNQEEQERLRLGV